MEGFGHGVEGDSDVWIGFVNDMKALEAYDSRFGPCIHFLKYSKFFFKQPSFLKISIQSQFLKNLQQPLSSKRNILQSLCPILQRVHYLREQ
jgi:hypothetical protein